MKEHQYNIYRWNVTEIYNKIIDNMYIGPQQICFQKDKNLLLFMYDPVLGIGVISCRNISYSYLQLRLNINSFLTNY